MSWEHFSRWTFRLFWKAGKSMETVCATPKRKQQRTEKGKYLQLPGKKKPPARAAKQQPLCLGDGRWGNWELKFGLEQIRCGMRWRPACLAQSKGDYVILPPLQCRGCGCPDMMAQARSPPVCASPPLHPSGLPHELQLPAPTWYSQFGSPQGRSCLTSA